MKKTIDHLDTKDLYDKRVLVRVDFNVPQDEKGAITDDSRIQAAVPTIKRLLANGAKVILVSHLGRPKGKREEKYTLKPAAERLGELLGKKTGLKVIFVDDCVGPKVKAAVDKLEAGQVMMLENVRFHEGEEKNDPEFAKQLGELAELYVNDAFGTAHRAHASTEGVTNYLRPALAGLLLDKEIRMLSEALNSPQRPVATIIGGAKVSSKIGVLDNLLEKVDVMIIGGAMAFSFLKARGLNVGKSLVEDDKLDYCKQLEKKAQEKGVKLILPVDVVCAPEIKEGAAATTVDADKIPADQMGLDVGPKSIKEIKDALASCKTILWNGPLGVFEVKGFEKGTFELVDYLVELTKNGARTIVGGGDSVAALQEKNVPNEALTHVSTGGGASLEFLEGLELPGIKCLDPAKAPARA